MSNFATNKLELKPIQDLLIFNYKKESIYQFVVPSYQRGYKWGTLEVISLLDDVWEFKTKIKKEVNEIYCLQPIVVKKQNLQYELIDGQQRLTTIYLILSYFNLDCFQLSYETREASREFLKRLTSERNFFQYEKDLNVDYWHICNAWEQIQQWVTNMKQFSETFEDEFLKCFLEQVKVIWYEVDENTESREIYSRLNVGKIPLTNAELIKALILSNENKSHQKDKIAIMWDQIETRLQDDKIWCFLTNTNDINFKLETRIDFLLDLVTNKPEELKKDEREKYFSFRKFQSIHNSNASETDKLYWKDQNIKSINDAWLKLEEIFETINDWYDDGKIYHYVGYVICFTLCPKDKHPVQYLYELYRKSTKSKFIKSIKLKIIENINKEGFSEIKMLVDDIHNLRVNNQSNQSIIIEKETQIRTRITEFLEQQEYNADKKHLRKILLLFNILTVMQNQKMLEEKNGAHTLQTFGNIFPFDLFKKEIGWDIEHVHSQTDKNIVKKEDQLEWLYNTYLDVETEVKQNLLDSFDISISNDFNDEKIKMEMEIVINSIKSADFEKLKKELASTTENGISNKDSLFNLTLLDCRTNRSYQNALFPTKRRILLNRDKKGQFVPICTKNLFQKYYTKDSAKISVWSDTDSNGYKNAMVEMFVKMIIE